MTNEELTALIFIKEANPHNKMENAIKEHSKFTIDSLIRKQYIKTIINEHGIWLLLTIKADRLLYRLNQLVEIID